MAPSAGGGYSGVGEEKEKRRLRGGELTRLMGIKRKRKIMYPKDSNTDEHTRMI